MNQNEWKMVLNFPSEIFNLHTTGVFFSPDLMINFSFSKRLWEWLLDQNQYSQDTSRVFKISQKFFLDLKSLEEFLIYFRIFSKYQHAARRRNTNFCSIKKLCSGNILRIFYFYLIIIWVKVLKIFLWHFFTGSS